MVNDNPIHVPTRTPLERLDRDWWTPSGTLVKPVNFYGAPYDLSRAIVPWGAGKYVAPQWSHYGVGSAARARCVKTGRFLSWACAESLPRPFMRTIAQVRHVRSDEVVDLAWNVCNTKRASLEADPQAYKNWFVVCLQIKGGQNIPFGTVPISRVFTSQDEAMKYATDEVVRYGHSHGYSVSI